MPASMACCSRTYARRATYQRRVRNGLRATHASAGLGTTSDLRGGRLRSNGASTTTQRHAGAPRVTQRERAEHAAVSGMFERRQHHEVGRRADDPGNEQRPPRPAIGREDACGSHHDAHGSPGNRGTSQPGEDRPLADAQDGRDVAVAVPVNDEVGHQHRDRGADDTGGRDHRNQGDRGADHHQPMMTGGDVGSSHRSEQRGRQRAQRAQHTPRRQHLDDRHRPGPALTEEHIDERSGHHREGDGHGNRQGCDQLVAPEHRARAVAGSSRASTSR